MRGTVFAVFSVGVVRVTSLNRNRDTSSWLGPIWTKSEWGGTVAWGDVQYGGNMTSAAQAALDAGAVVDWVFPNERAFAALLASGRVIAWGDADSGGTIPTTVEPLLRRVHTVYATDRAFAARLRDGSVVTWGDPSYGGAFSNGAATTAALDGTVAVVDVVSTSRAFVAVRSDGVVVAWGAADYGGTLSSTVEASITNGGGVASVVGNDHAFAAITNGGALVAWGGANDTVPDTSGLDTALTVNCRRVFATSTAFVLLKDMATTTTTTTYTTTTITATSTTITTTTTTTSRTTTTKTTKTTTTITTVTTTTTTTSKTTTTITTTTITTTTTTTVTTTTTTTSETTTTITTTTITTTTTTTSVCDPGRVDIEDLTCCDGGQLLNNGALCDPASNYTGFCASAPSCDGVRPNCLNPVGAECNETVLGYIGWCDNVGYCRQHSSPKKAETPTMTIVAAVCGVIGVLLFGVLLLFCCKKYGKKTVKVVTSSKSKVAPAGDRAKSTRGRSAKRSLKPGAGVAAGASRKSLTGFFRQLESMESGMVLVDDGHSFGFAAREADGGESRIGFKKTVNRLLHLNGITQTQATKLRRYSEVDAERALRTAFADFTRHEVARLREQLLYSATLNPKLKNRLAKKLELVQKEIDAAEQDALMEAEGISREKEMQDKTMRGLTRDQAKQRLQTKNARKERMATTAAQLRTRLTAKITAIEAEIRSQSQQDTVLMQSVARFEDRVVQLRGILQTIPNSADKGEKAAHEAAKHEQLGAFNEEVEKIEFFLNQYKDTITKLNKKVELPGASGKAGMPAPPAKDAKIAFGSGDADGGTSKAPTGKRKGKGKDKGKSSSPAPPRKMPPRKLPPAKMPEKRPA